MLSFFYSSEGKVHVMLKYIIFTDVLSKILPYFNSRAQSMSTFFKITVFQPAKTSISSRRRATSDEKRMFLQATVFLLLPSTPAALQNHIKKQYQHNYHMSHGPSSQVSYIRNLEAEIFKKCIILGNFQSVVVNIAPKNNQSQAEIVKSQERTWNCLLGLFSVSTPPNF